MDDVEPARRDPLARRAIAVVEMRDQRRRPAMLCPGKGLLVMPVEHRIDREARIAVARREQHDVVAARDQPLGQIPAVRFHAPHERLRDPLADMGEQRDPHAATGSAVRASRMRMMLAVLA